jgi:hypothetical protein
LLTVVGKDAKVRLDMPQAGNFCMSPTASLPCDASAGYAFLGRYYWQVFSPHKNDLMVILGCESLRFKNDIPAADSVTAAKYRLIISILRPFESQYRVIEPLLMSAVVCISPRPMQLPGMRP